MAGRLSTFQLFNQITSGTYNAGQIGKFFG